MVQMRLPGRFAMKTSVIKVNVFLGLLLFGSLSQASTVICPANQSVPPGKVVIREFADGACPNNIAWTIEVPTSPDTICRTISPYPAGFVTTAEVWAGGCPQAGGAPTGLVIRKPGVGPLGICSSLSPFPNGYFVAGVASDGNCPSTGAYWNVLTIKKPGATAIMCSISPLPPGYKITGTTNKSNCPGSSPNARNIKKIG